MTYGKSLFSGFFAHPALKQLLTEVAFLFV